MASCIKNTTTQYTLLVLPPDTDVYMIGLPLQCSHSKHIIVQISKVGSHELKLLCTKTLIQALANDPDLANIPTNTQATLLRALFVITGCDYIFFFSGIGKGTFVR